MPHKSECVKSGQCKNKDPQNNVYFEGRVLANTEAILFMIK